MKIAIIVGSIRDKRKTQPVAEYVYGIARQRSSGADYDLVDLRDFDVPPLTSPVHPMVANKSYDDPRVQAWSDKIDTFDGYVFVTPEYNHGVPGGFKNAVDTLGKEWVGKAVAFVGHGSVGGVRGIEQWRQIVSNFSMHTVRAELNFNSFFDWDDDTFTPAERHEAEVNTMLDHLEGMLGRMGRDV